MRGSKHFTAEHAEIAENRQLFFYGSPSLLLDAKALQVSTTQHPQPSYCRCLLRRSRCTRGEELYLATFTGRWNISSSAVFLSVSRFRPRSYAAPTKVLNKGCGSSGFDLNSGW